MALVYSRQPDIVDLFDGTLENSLEVLTPKPPLPAYRAEAGTSDTTAKQPGGRGADGRPEDRSIGDWLYGLAGEYATGCLILLLVAVFCAAIVSSRHKHFWYDEIFTIIVASQPTWHTLAHAMPADGQPPVTALLTRLSIHFFGITNFGVRLPEMVGFLAALTGVFVFVRREVGAVFGLLAVVVMISQPAWMYSFEARPYGILLAFLMLAMVSWQSAMGATPVQPRKLALAGLGVAVVGCILTHHLGLVSVGLPLVFGEAGRLYERRRVDWSVVGTVAAAAVAGLSISVPMMRHTNELLFVHLPPVSLQAIREAFPRAKVSFPEVVNVGLFELLVFVLFVTWCPWVLNKLHAKKKVSVAGSVVRPAAPVLFAAAGLLVLIPVTYALMTVHGGWYFARYGIGSVLGIAVLFPMLLAGRGEKYKVVVVSLILFLSFSYLLALQQNLRRLKELPSDRLVYDDTSTLSIVISDPLVYPQVWWYAPADVKGRLIYLSETPTKLPSGSAVVEAALVAERTHFPAPIGGYRAFVDHHRHFLLDAGTIDANLEQALVAEGFRLTRLRGDAQETLYDVQR